MDLYLITFADGSTLVEYGDSVQDVQGFCNRSCVQFRGAVKSIELYNEAKHSA